MALIELDFRIQQEDSVYRTNVTLKEEGLKVSQTIVLAVYVKRRGTK